MPKQCPVHTHPKGPVVLRKVFDGQMDLRDAARELDISYPMVWRCYNYHYKIEAGSGSTSISLKEEADLSEAEFTEDLKEIIRSLKEKVHAVLEDSSAKDRPTAWIHQFRGAIRDLAELEGKLQKAPLIQLTQLNIQFEKLTTFIISQLCPECQKKVMQYLEEESKLKAAVVS